MTRLLHRIVAIILTACLMADPSVTQQALARPAVWRAITVMGSIEAVGAGLVPARNGMTVRNGHRLHERDFGPAQGRPLQDPFTSQALSLRSSAMPEFTPHDPKGTLARLVKPGIPVRLESPPAAPAVASALDGGLPWTSSVVDRQVQDIWGALLNNDDLTIDSLLESLRQTGVLLAHIQLDNGDLPHYDLSNHRQRLEWANRRLGELYTTGLQNLWKNLCRPALGRALFPIEGVLQHVLPEGGRGLALLFRSGSDLEIYVVDSGPGFDIEGVFSRGETGPHSGVGMGISIMQKGFLRWYYASRNKRFFAETGQYDDYPTPSAVRGAKFAIRFPAPSSESSDSPATPVAGRVTEPRTIKAAT